MIKTNRLITGISALAFGFLLYMSDYETAYAHQVTQTYSANTDVNPIICEDAAVLTAVDNLTNIAEGVEEKLDEVEQVYSTVYVVPVNTAVNVVSGEIQNGASLTLSLSRIQEIVEEDIEFPSWDTRKRYKDILILDEILVNQLGMSPTKAAAIIGNICYEDSFCALTNSAAQMSNINEARSRLGNGTRGFGIAQWTTGKRQNELEKYYIEVNNSGLSWELTSVISEAAYLYNELYVSGIIGNLSEEGDLEHMTGVVANQYESYASAGSEWSMSNGEYHSNGSPRYTYAKYIYDSLYGG